MKNEIKILDLFCGVGGSAMGFYSFFTNKGFKVKILGIDKEPQPNYPFEFLQKDIEIEKINTTGFDFINASPPCQLFTVANSGSKMKIKIHKNLIPLTRKLIGNKPGIIENVPTAPIKADLKLRGDMFGLKVLRKRHFELLNWFSLCTMLPTKKGTVKNGDYVTVVGNGQLKPSRCERFKFEKQDVLQTWKTEMKIDWATNRKELAQAIPPAYTYFIAELYFEFLMKTKPSVSVNEQH